MRGLNLLLAGAMAQNPDSETTNDAAPTTQDCKAVRQEQYATATECVIDMNCPSSQYCGGLSADHCEFACLETCGDASALTLTDGKLCVGDYGFSYDCQVVENNLKFSVVVPKISSFHPTYDERKISLVSGAIEETIAEADGATKVFEESACAGEQRNDTIWFEDVVNGENGCDVGSSEKVEINGKMFDLWTFAVGFDDLWDTDPVGNEVIKRYGRHWVYQCAVLLEDYQAVKPNAGGDRVAESEWGQTSIPFELKIFSDDTFTTEFGDTDQRDIGVLSEEEQKVYVQGQVMVENKFLHLGYCLVKVYDEDADGNQLNEQDFRFLENGCLVDDQFVERNFFLGDDRTTLSDSSVQTIDKEQFSVDLWDTSVGESTETKTYHFECQLMACDSLTGEGVEEYCQVDDQCPNRYSNLEDVVFGGARRRRRDVSPAESAFPGQTVSANLVFSRHPRNAEQTGSGAAAVATTGALLSLAVFLM